MIPPYLLLMSIGVLLALVCAKLPNEQPWNKVAMFGLFVATALIVYGFMMYADARQIVAP